MRRPFTLLIHIAAVLMIAGALLSTFCSDSGYLHLRVGESLERPFDISLESFGVDYIDGTETPRDFVSGLVVDGKSRVVRMNHPMWHRGWCILQSDYDRDGEGSVLMAVHDPWGTGVTFLSYFVLLVGLIGVFFERNSVWRESLNRLEGVRRTPWIIAIAAFIVLMSLVVKRFFFSGSALMPVLRTPLLAVHVSIVMASYALLGVAAVVAIAAFCRRRTTDGLAKSSDICISLVFPGEMLLIAGTFIGAVWASVSWGRYWTWDPKETWALVTLLVYSIVLHSRQLKFASKPRVILWFCILAFCCVLFTYFGVNYLLGGMHSYV